MSFYRELAPARALQALLACRWERLVSEQSSSTTLVLPDGCVDLIWRGGDVVVAGPDRRSNPTEVGSGERIIGLRLRPGAAGAVLGLPTSEVLDARLPLVDVLGAWSSRARRADRRWR